MAKMAMQFLLNSIRQHSNAVLETLPITNNDLVVSEINIFDAQTNALCQAQAATVEQPGHQPILSRHAAYQILDLRLCEDSG